MLRRQVAVADSRRAVSASIDPGDLGDLRLRPGAEEDNREVDELKAQVVAGAPDAVVQYFSLVLDGSSYPDGLPRHHRLAYVPESKQLVVELVKSQAFRKPSFRPPRHAQHHEHHGDDQKPLLLNHPQHQKHAPHTRTPPRQHGR